MREVETLIRTHSYLVKEGLAQKAVINLYTDAHPTLLEEKSLEPFQRFTLDRGDFVVHPDIVGQLNDGETLFAVEAKGRDDILLGIAQSELYLNGFHYSFLAADKKALGYGYVSLAKDKHIGIISVDENVTRIIYLPEPRMPVFNQYQSIRNQMKSVLQVSGKITFLYNLPTHYLVWPILLRKRNAYDIKNLPDWGDYPMPRDWKGALYGAQKLGLVKVSGNEVRLTATGEAVKDLLPVDISAWTQVHNYIKMRESNATLVNCNPQAAAVLRMLLLQDEMVSLLIKGLESFETGSANFAQLARKCDEFDHTRAPIFFLKPESATKLMDEQGHISWNKAAGEDYRSTMFYQYKSILKHAGILAPLALGGATSKQYDPTKDIWALANDSA